ncbi:hypothetical protein CROQUDRAFT_86673 [Cronartium quercuum f. sp. fusiforme G11]|uniref:Myb-like domain-containing protein n=1 Tax=Cronartium quercuum f. sp. fusiforme G11 TaxID=708437 RepID=A0A9P6NSW7_9BASI|nr:hypothetical protein CROQUDRAFT_86673 [Cronartium quercuum f. sp. fusiforme G11]
MEPPGPSHPSGDPAPSPPVLPHPSTAAFSTLLPLQSRRPRSNTTPTHRWPPPITPTCFPSDLPAAKNVHQSASECENSGGGTINTIGQLRKRLSRPSLKREATSPVYLDENTVSIPSIPSAGRRVAPCMPSRLRGGDSDVASISSQDEVDPREKEKENKEKKRRGVQRNKWTKEETEALVRGCNTFAIGQWKAIRDSDPLLASRSPGDLKDRFRTYFPDAYRKHYPNAKTHISTRVRSVDSEGKPLFGEGAVRRERKQFSLEEDEALKKGYAKYGTAWSSIQRDPILSARKATDLRDRFRNAFPDLYAAAGYKSRARKASVSAVFSYLPVDPTGSTSSHGTFEAMDVPGCPTYPNRAFAQIRPGQVAHYEFPSLDFLKAHGADAFSDFRTMIYGSAPLSATQYDFDEHQIPLGAIPNHLTNNSTPRPNLTPRPNDTTPRPKITLRKDVSTSALGDPVLSEPEVKCEDDRPLALVNTVSGPGFRPLHKTQSSLDLSQFSNLHLVDAHNLASPTSSQFSAGGFQGFEQYDFPGGEGTSNSSSPYLSGLCTYSSPDLSVGPEPLAQSGRTVERFFASHSAQDVPSDWLPDFDIASQTFPSAFGFGEGIMNMADAQSSVSSFHSSHSSMSDHLQLEEHDRVLYTAAVANQPGFFDPLPNSPSGISGIGSGAHETLYPGPEPPPVTANLSSSSHDQTLFSAGLAFDETEPGNSPVEGAFA